jgi:hypothetical protein
MATTRTVIDCRWFLEDIPCDIAIPGNKEAVLNLAIHYAVESRGYRDTPALREQLRSLLLDASQIEVIRPGSQRGY